MKGDKKGIVSAFVVDEGMATHTHTDTGTHTDRHTHRHRDIHTHAHRETDTHSSFPDTLLPSLYSVPITLVEKKLSKQML